MSKFTIDKLQNVIVQMKLPVSFDVLDSLTKENKGKPYMMQIDNIPAKIHFKRIYDFRYKDDFEMAPFSKMEEDRSALLSYMQVQVWFDKQMIESSRINKKIITIIPDQFVDIAIEYLNKFINIYRSITNSFWIRNVVLKDVFNYQYLLLDTEGQHQTVTTLIPKHHMIRFNGGKEFELEEKQEDILRHYLLEDYYGFKDDIVSSMLDNFNLGRYNFALIQSATLFENFIYTELKKKLSNTKLDKIKKKPECGCLAGISEVCSRGIKEYFEFDFGATKEWEDVKNYMLKLRNRIVHGELIKSISKNECEKALVAVKASQELLIEKVFNKSS
ncbi:hypothetical protein SAMN05661096_03436 [Marivirga sericea]|uniref:Apea-like HEPN domain-containing protein n=1 Tax=Marivirga sericea TaxID=1028 RepID=A0A1X7L551_9BACT|nr:hypothetical protein [Marivirga sericea]SMG48189.1 hypothetical protein SAMN05661096_03436 [Marivirga sericea]